MSVKIMCVDDSKTIQLLIDKSLSPEGIVVEMADNGKEALDKLSSDIDLFLVDVNMPVMGGFEFVENLKKIDTYKSKPVIFLTTESSTEKKEKGKALGINGWIVKPFDSKSLLKVIKMLID